MTNSSGQLVKEIGYRPFGESAYANDFLSTNVAVKYQFTGQEKDATGLMDYGARLYDPELGRFISPDPILDGLNRYTYCKNNPIRYTDPTGYRSESEQQTLSLMQSGGVSPAGVQALNNYYTNRDNGCGGGGNTNGNDSAKNPFQDFLNRAGNVTNNVFNFLGNNAGKLTNIYLGLQSLELGILAFGNGIFTGFGGGFGLSLANGGEESTALAGAALGLGLMGVGSGLINIGKDMIAANGTLDFGMFNNKGNSDGKSEATINNDAPETEQPFAEQMTPKEAAKYDKYWEDLTGRAPEKSAPYNILNKYDANGNLKSATTYDQYGNRAYQYEFGSARHGEGYHSYDNANEFMGSGKGPRSTHLEY